MARVFAPATALAGGLLLALSGGLGRSDALASSSSLGDLSVDGVQDLLQEWGLDSAFGAEFRAAGVDGWTLAHLAGGNKNNNKARRVHSLDRSRYPAAQFFHFDKLEARLLAATAGSAADEEAAEEAVSASGGLRRSLAASDEYSGLSIKRNNSQITMGANADVALLRTGAAELTVDAAAVMAEGDVFVAGDLMVDGGLAVGDDVYPFFPTMEQSPGKTLDIKVRSRGFDDPCVSDGWTGLSACNSAIVVNGVAKSLSRGHTIMYFDHETGDLTDTGYWDTHGDSNTTDEMVEWLEAIPIGDIVVVGTHDSAGEYEPFDTFASLLTFGMDADVHDLVLRESLCLIGRRGSEAQGAFLPWEQFVTTPQYDGPANCSATIQTGSYAASVSGTYDVTASQFNFNGMPVATHIWVRVLSIGYDDPGFGCVYTADAGGCTGPNRASAVWVNGAKIPFDSDATTHRGHNFVVINQITGLVEDAKSFDTHGESASADEIAWFVGNVTEGRIVVLAIHDAAGTYEHPESLLSLMAGHEFDADFELRESFCMIGRKGKVSTHWMTRFFNERFEGPSWCEATIPLLPPSYASAFETFDTEGEYVFGSRQLEAGEEDAAVAAAEPE